jgi:hypothetical protein
LAYACNFLSCRADRPFGRAFDPIICSKSRRETCDGFAGIQCDKGLWCEHPAGKCGVADMSGTYVEETAAACTEEHIPVCACGGKEFPNDCERKKAKAQLDYSSECKK